MVVDTAMTIALSTSVKAEKYTYFSVGWNPPQVGFTHRAILDFKMVVTVNVEVTDL